MLKIKTVCKVIQAMVTVQILQKMFIVSFEVEEEFQTGGQVLSLHKYPSDRQ